MADQPHPEPALLSAPALLPGYEHDIEAGAGLAATPGNPHVVLHTTESPRGSYAAIRNLWRGPANWGKGLPHFLADGSRYVQLLPLNVGAYTLQNTAGGADTNRSGPVIQVEICGYARDDFNDVEIDALAKWLADLVKAGVPLDLSQHPHFYGADEGIILATPGAPQRMSAGGYESFNGFCGHQHAPENCVTVDAPVLGSDLRWRPAVDYAPGDELLGFDAELVEVGSTGGRRMRPSTVEVNQPFKAEAFRVVTTEGEVVTTANHPWLVRWPYVNRGTRTTWVTTADLVPGKHQAYFTTQPWEVEHTHDAGWLAGALDADGHAQVNRDAGAWVGWGQVHGPMLDRFVFEMEARGFTLKQFDRTDRPGPVPNRQPFTDVRVTGGLWEQLRCLGTLQPHRLNLRRAWDGAVVGKTARRVEILAVEPGGRRWMAGLQTSTRTFVAGGFLMHNSHWDPGRLDADRVEREARAHLGETPESEDDDMTVVCGHTDGRVFACWGLFKRHLTPDELGAYLFMGAKDLGTSDGFLALLTEVPRGKVAGE